MMNAVCVGHGHKSIGESVLRLIERVTEMKFGAVELREQNFRTNCDGDALWIYGCLILR